MDDQPPLSTPQDVALAELRRDVDALQRAQRFSDRLARWLQTVIFAVILVLLAVLVITTLLGVLNLGPSEERSLVVYGVPRTAPQVDILSRAEEVLDSAQNASDGANRVLSFLESMGVLVALALGAAAIYGFRNTQQIREELARDRERIERELDRIEAMRQEMEQHRDDLRSLPQHIAEVGTLRTEVETARQDLENVQPFFTDLLLANQELLVNNYEEAYRAVRRVLEQAPGNPMALYIAGWIELQYIPDSQELGMQHLRQFYQENPTWPIARAVYGVVLRRQASRHPQPEQDNVFNQAYGLLLEALGENPGLLDLNRESLWGPVGGILRQRGRYMEAMQAYERASRVTPGSSYPHGNLAALYLREARESDTEDEYRAKRQQALETFRTTLILARSELAIEPNDYFHVMDIAMSNAVLTADVTAGEGAVSAAASEAVLWLNRALQMQDVTAEMLQVSLRGWRYLIEACPERPEWEITRQHLAWAGHAVAVELVRAARRGDRSEAALLPLYEDALTALSTALEAGPPPGYDRLPEQAQTHWLALAQDCPDNWEAARAVIDEALAALQA